MFLVKVFASCLCLLSFGGFFYVWDKKVVDMFIQVEVFPVLCLWDDRARYRRGRMPSRLCLEQVVCICKFEICSGLRFIGQSFYVGIKGCERE